MNNFIKEIENLHIGLKVIYKAGNMFVVGAGVYNVAYARINTVVKGDKHFNSKQAKFWNSDNGKQVKAIIENFVEKGDFTC